MPTQRRFTIVSSIWASWWTHPIFVTRWLYLSATNPRPASTILLFEGPYKQKKNKLTTFLSPLSMILICSGTADSPWISGCWISRKCVESFCGENWRNFRPSQPWKEQTMSSGAGFRVHCNMIRIEVDMCRTLDVGNNCHCTGVTAVIYSCHRCEDVSYKIQIYII